MTHITYRHDHEHWIAECLNQDTGDHYQLSNRKGTTRLIYRRPHPDGAFVADVVNPARFGLTHRVLGGNEWRAIIHRFINAVEDR